MIAPRTGFVNAIKTLEDFRYMLRRNPGSRVRDGKLHACVGATFDSRRDRAARRCELDGVVQDIYDRLSDVKAVACTPILSSPVSINVSYLSSINTSKSAASSRTSATSGKADT